MSRLLEWMFGRLPIGWLQLVHNRTRLAAAVAGVTFANVLIFMQLGFLGALVGTIKLPYEQMNADIVVSASDMNTLADGSPIPRQRMFEALGVTGVREATPVYYGKLDWRQPDGTSRTLDVFGVDPSVRAFKNPDIDRRLADLALLDNALIDNRTRTVPRAVFDAISYETPLRFEARGRTLNIVDTFTIGGGFGADGYLIVSDSTFLRLFPQRSAGAPNHIFLTLEPGADRAAVTQSLSLTLPSSDSVARPVSEMITKDQKFQTTQRPIGVVFGFGIIIGALVGVIIVYQVLATDVADHLKEYATFKAIGYRQGFFLGIIFEEAGILAALGFVPGVTLSLGLYALVAKGTGLALAMSWERAGGVLGATFAMCALSGAVATRRLAKANPAELF